MNIPGLENAMIDYQKIRVCAGCIVSKKKELMGAAMKFAKQD
jgi:hypothetical protein